MVKDKHDLTFKKIMSKRSNFVALEKNFKLEIVEYLVESFRKTGNDLKAEDKVQILRYAMDTWDVDNEKLLAKIVQENSTMEDIAMTAGEQLRIEGRQQERQEIVNKLVAAGFDIKAVQAAAELSDEEIKAILDETD